MARRRRPAPPSPLLLPILALSALVLPGLAALWPVVPLSLAEAPDWARATSGAALPLDAPPLPAWLTRGALLVLGDTLTALRLPAVLLLAVLTGLLAWRAPMAAIAVLGAPLVWWLALSGLPAVLPMLAAAPLALALERAAAPRPKREKRAPLAPWLWLGAAAALALHVLPVMAVPLAVVLVLLTRLGTGWRGPLLAAGVAALASTPFAIWCMATQGAPLHALLPEAGSVPLWQGALALAALGPLLLAGLRGGIDALALWAWALLGFAAGLALWGRLTPELAALPVAALALRAAGLTLRGPGLIAAALPGPMAGAGVLALSTLYAAYGTGLPAAADPHADRRADGAFCEEVLLALEETAAEALIAPDREALLPCAWQGGLRGVAVLSLDTTSGPPVLRQAQGPLALEGREALLVAFWPSDGTAEAARFARAEPLGSSAVPAHEGRERRFALWLVGDWRGG